MRVNGILTVFMLMILTGCKITPSKQPLVESVNNRDIRVFSYIQQEELEAMYHVQDTSAAGVQFGLIGGLVLAGLDGAVNASNKADAEELLVALKAELNKFNFDTLFEQELQRKLSSNLQFKDIKTVKKKKLIGKGIPVGELYLVLNTSYKLVVDFRTPMITTHVEIREKGKKKNKILYANNFTYFGNSLPLIARTQDHIDADVAKVQASFSALPKEDKKNLKKRSRYFRDLKKAKRVNFSFEEQREMTAKAWTEQHSGQMELNLRKGIQDLFSIIASDIKDTTDPATYENQGNILPGHPQHNKTVTLADDDKRKVIRFTYGYRNGAICSMPSTASNDKIVCL